MTMTRVGLRGAVVVEQVVRTAGADGELVHHLLDDARARRRRSHCTPRGPGRTRRDSAPCRGSSGASGVSARARCAAMSSSGSRARMSSSSRAAILATSCDVRKPSKKCRTGMRDAQRRRLADEGEVVRFLHRGRRQQHHPRLAAGHDVGVVAEDRQRVRGHGAGRDVHAERRQFAGDLVEVGDHQQQALACREGRRQRARSAARRARHRWRRPPTASRSRRARRPTGSSSPSPTTRRRVRPCSTRA